MAELFYNAHVKTMDSANPVAAAFVTINEYFAFAGSEGGARAWLKTHGYDNFDETDLGGRLVIPGFNDSHMHYLHYAKAKLSVDLTGCASLKEVISRMKKGLESYDPAAGLWLVGEGWNQDFFTDEKRFPTARDLDLVTKDHPIIIMRSCFHVGVLNSKAMELLNFDSNRARECGIFAEVMADGTPNGVIKENVFDDIKAELPAPSLSTLLDMMAEAQHDMFAAGITSLQTDDFKYVPAGKAYEMMALLRDAAQSGRIKLRIAEQALLTEKETVDEFFQKGFSGDYGDKNFKISSVKILADGSLGARTALMQKPYADDPSTLGLAIYQNQSDLDYIVGAAHRHNMPALIHAIGDGAIEMCLNAIEKARKAMPHLSPRHGIVHCQITTKEQLKRFKELDVVAYTQPIFLDYDMHIVYDRVGKELAETSYAFKDYLDLGVHQAFGTDCPVEHYNPLPGIYCAVTRKDLKGWGPYLENQAVSLEEALYLYTAAGAYCTGEENIKGKITPGHLADFVVFEDNIFEMGIEEIVNAKVQKTYIGGQPVFEK